MSKAIAFICCLALPAALTAQTGGQGGHAASGHASTGTGQSGASHPATASAPAPAPTTAPAHTRPRDGRPIGIAIPRPPSASATSPFDARPSTYAPYYSSPYINDVRVRPYMSLYPVLGFTTFGYTGVGYPGATSVCGYGFDCPTTYMETYPGVPPEDSGSVTQPTGPTSPQPEDQTGNLRLDVQPVSTQIFVDGYFMGTVQDFSDTLAGLRLIAGPHHLELRAPGYETIVLDVMIGAGRTINYRATLKALP